MQRQPAQAWKAATHRQVKEEALHCLLAPMRHLPRCSRTKRATLCAPNSPLGRARTPHDLASHGPAGVTAARAPMTRPTCWPLPTWRISPTSSLTLKPLRLPAFQPCRSNGCCLPAAPRHQQPASRTTSHASLKASPPLRRPHHLPPVPAVPLSAALPQRPSSPLSERHQ